jgi:site-specific recombinase XerD
MRLVSKYEDFMAPFLILRQQGEIYMKKIRPVLAQQRSLPGQPPYFFLNKQGGRLCGSNMSNFFTESFEKCCGEKSVRPHMIRHSVASYIRDNKPEMLETAAGFMKHSLAACRKNYAEASSKGELYFPSICSHFTLFEIIL